MTDISEQAVAAAAKAIRENQWDRKRDDVLDTAMQLWDAWISVLVTRESLESAALQMARYIITQEADFGRLARASPALLAALQATEASDLAHSNCDECEGLGEAEECEKCFPAADDARLKRRAAIHLVAGSSDPQ